MENMYDEDSQDIDHQSTDETVLSLDDRMKNTPWISVTASNWKAYLFLFLALSLGGSGILTEALVDQFGQYTGGPFFGGDYSGCLI